MQKFALAPVLCALLGASLAGPTMPAFAQKFPSNEEMRQIRALARPRLSPDGKQVLLQVNDTTVDGGKSHLWLIEIDKNTDRQITFSSKDEKRGEYGGEWMPDGSILFLAHRGEHTQLYRLAMDGGEARPYDLKVVPPVDQSTEPDAVPPPAKDAKATKPEPVAIDVQNFSASPDGKWIAIIAKDPETPGEKKEHDEKADAVWVNHDPHGSRLYLLDAASNPASEKLTPAAVPPDVERVAWNRKGDRLIAISGGMNEVSDLGPASTAWLLDVANPGSPQQIKAAPKTIAGGSWSNDGNKFYFLAQATENAPPGYEDLYEMNVADRSSKDLTGGLKGSVGHEMPIPDAGSVLQQVELGTRVSLLRIGPNGSEPLKFGPTAVTQVDTNANHDGWVWLATSSNQPQTVYYAAKLGDEPKALASPAQVPAGWTHVQSKLVHWKNEGLDLEGILFLPPQATAGAKVPLIVDVHGGPTGAWEDSYVPFTEFLLGQGWAVFRPNPRGSTGYGAKFAAANYNDLGGADLHDILTGVDAVVAQYPVDANRLGLMGYSYGGEMAGFMEGRTTRFKAIVSGAPVIDQESEYGTESGSWYDRWFYGLPWEHATDAWRQSPLSTAGHAKTPFLLLQGQGDTTDPPGQSEEMYRALRQMGVPVDLIEYPRDNHGPLAMAMYGSPVPEPWHGFDARQRVVKFFNAAFSK